MIRGCACCSVVGALGPIGPIGLFIGRLGNPLPHRGGPTSPESRIYLCLLVAGRICSWSTSELLLGRGWMLFWGLGWPCLKSLESRWSLVPHGPFGPLRLLGRLGFPLPELRRCF